MFSEKTNNFDKHPDGKIEKTPEHKEKYLAKNFDDVNAFVSLYSEDIKKRFYSGESFNLAVENILGKDFLSKFDLKKQEIISQGLQIIHDEIDAA